MATTGEVGTASNTGGDFSRPRGGDGQRGRGRGGRGTGGGGGGRGRGRGGGGGGGDSSRGAGGGGGRGRGRGGGHSQGRGQQQQQQTQQQPTDQDTKGKLPAFKVKPEEGAAEDDDADVCFICANPISHHSIAPCNHNTCHICALRLRALYKNKDCPHCRTAAPFVIFTDDPNKRFEEYKDSEITSTDDNIGIRYAGEDIVGDTILLLRYNCPDGDCDFAGLGWPDLHRHVRAVHHKKMCDLCTRNKKVFTHEHEMFTDKELGEHMRKGDDKPGAVDQTGFKGHPLCNFCGERFYDGDKLYEHCRSKHERCFLCDRRDSRQPHYYLDYNALENHFKKDHFLCYDRECLEKKFVVFDTEIDLKAHQVSEHGNQLSKDARRDARVVDMSAFDFRPSYQQERQGGGRGGGGREGRRGRDPNAEPIPASSAQPLRRDELAFQRQLAISQGQQQAQASSSSRPNPPPSSRPTQPPPRTGTPSTQPIIDAMQNVSVNDLSSLTPEQRAGLTRHGAVIERASNLLGSDSTKINSFRTYISNYNRGSMTAEQLIDAFFALFSETSSNALGTLVREVAELFEDKKKAEALRKAWQNWRAINEDYPSLPGIGGMHGATSSNSGWAAAAAASSSAGGASASPAVAAQQAKHSTRVLKLKNSTRRGSSSSLEQAVLSSIGGSGSRGTSGGGGLSYSERVIPSSSSTAAFPALPGASKAKSTGSSQPSWIGGSSPALASSGAGRGSGGAASDSGSGTRTTASSVAAAAGVNRKPPGSGEDAFPALPAAPKPQTTIFGYGRGAVRRDLGGFGNRDTGFSWGGGNASGSGSGAQGQGQGQQGGSNENEEDGGAGGGGKGKGKKNKKQVLVQWG